MEEEFKMLWDACIDLIRVHPERYHLSGTHFEEEHFTLVETMHGLAETADVPMNFDELDKYNKEEA